MNILHLDSSARHQTSVTRGLSTAAVEQLRRGRPDASVVYRDLTSDPLPHISPEFIGGIFGAPELADHATVELSDRLIAELFTSDVVVIGAPMYNFGIPSQLKAWIDHVVRAGKTFRYSTDGQPEGLVTGKRAIVAVASGGVYTAGPMVSHDHVGMILTQILGFIGITDVKIVRAEQQAFGEAAAEGELARAVEEIARLTA